MGAPSSGVIICILDGPRGCKLSSEGTHGTWLSVVSERSHRFHSDVFNTLIVSIDHPKPANVLIIGHSTCTPSELFIFPILHRHLPHWTFKLNVKCCNPSWFLPKGQVIAQAVTLPDEIPQCTPLVFWAEWVGPDKPYMRCKLDNGNAITAVNGMIDTGADVTIISEAH